MGEPSSSTSHSIEAWSYSDKLGTEGDFDDFQLRLRPNRPASSPVRPARSHSVARIFHGRDGMRHALISIALLALLSGPASAQHPPRPPGPPRGPDIAPPQTLPGERVGPGIGPGRRVGPPTVRGARRIGPTTVHPQKPRRHAKRRHHLRMPPAPPRP